jgi:hypothetical protein
VKRLQTILLGLAISIQPIAFVAASPITLTFETNSPAHEISADFIGLSFETQVLLPSSNGQSLFNSNNTHLITLFKTLGVESLRIGGNTADLPVTRIPGPPEIDNLFGFAQAAGVKVIYTLRLRNGDITNDIAIAKYIEEHHPGQLSYFAIGNEPDYYRKVYPILKTYSAYRDTWKQFATALRSAGVTTPFCGPCTGGITSWTRNFANDFASSGLVALITQHDYPGGPGRRATNAAVARDQLLSAEWLDHYGHFYNAFAATAVSNHLPYRLEEISNFSDGGVKDASDTFAAALWCLDYMHWWAEHGATGINFHGRRWVPNCVIRQDLNVRPIGYGLKAFDLGGHGSIRPLKITNPDALDLTAYAVRQGTNTFHGVTAQRADVSIVASNISKSAALISLVVPESYVAAENGVTLGGASIQDDGSWAGKWTSVEVSRVIQVPAASAAILKISGS